MPSGRVSSQLFQRAVRVLPGGVSSPVRYYPPYPRFIRRGRGSHIVDVEGNDYVDLTLAYGPLLMGHAHPVVERAVKDQLQRGTIFGAPTALEVEVAELLRDRFPSMEMARFVTTGGEAALSLLRLARGATGKGGVAKIDGGFHGSIDQLLVSAGSGAASVASSEGVFPSSVTPTYLLPFNDIEAAEALLERQKDIGLLLVEPVMGNMGTIVPRPEYLRALRTLTRRHSVLLGFDEVITGFHAGHGGAQGRYEVTPDLTMLGKVLGGGLPLAAYGGRRDLLSRVAPSGGVYQAGTYSGNPLSLAAARSVLRWLTPARMRRVERETQSLVADLEGAFRERAVPVQIPHVGSMFSIFLSDREIRSATDVRKSRTQEYVRFARSMLREGVFLPQNPFESLFLSAVHSAPDRARVVRAAQRSISRAIVI